MFDTVVQWCADNLVHKHGTDALFPLLAHSVRKERDKEMAESGRNAQSEDVALAKKVLIGVTIQIITATLAATISSFVTLTVLEHRISTVEKEVASQKLDMKENQQRHLENFHFRPGGIR